MPARDWADPAQYEHMPGYEASDFAAEYLLRNPAFRADCRVLAVQAKTITGTLISAPAFLKKWGGDFEAGQDELPSPRHIVWAEHAFPRVLRTTRLPPSLPGSQPIRLTALPGIHVHVERDQRHVVWPAPGGPHRILAEKDIEGVAVNTVVLPLDDAFETRLDAAHRAAPPGRPTGHCRGRQSTDASSFFAPSTPERPARHMPPLFPLPRPPNRTLRAHLSRP